MKRAFFFAGLALAMVFSLNSCNKEIENTIANNGVKEGTPFEIIATPVQTRTENDGMDTKWVADDAINVFHAVEGTTDYVSDGEFTIADVSTNRFKGTVSETLDADKKYDWYMFYPYSTHITTPANTNAGYTIVGSRNNGNQTQAGNNSKAHIAGPDYPLFGVIPSVASTEIPSVSVNQVCSFIEFNVTNNSNEELVVSNILFTASENIVGTYYINFVDPENVVFTPSTNSEGTFVYASEKASLNVTDGEALAEGESAKFYIGIKPFTVSAGTLKVAVNGYEKELNITKSTSFSAGKIKKINFNYDKEPEVLPVYDNTSSAYTTGFEDGFTAGSVYNNTLEKLDGPENEQWASYYGTVSTNSKLNGSNSMQMRWYTASSSNIGYARTNFMIAEVGSVSFYAAATNNLNLSLYYMTEDDEDWVLAQTFTLTTNSKQYSYSFSTPVENAQLKFQIALPATNPTSTSNVRIDDIVISKTVPTYSISIDSDITNGTVTTSATTATEGTVITLEANPNEGYVLDRLTVKTDGGNTISLSTITETEYSFQMPGDNVTISAGFRSSSSTGVVLYEETFGTTGNNTAVASYSGWSWTGSNHPDGWKVSKPDVSGNNTSEGAYTGASGKCNLYSGSENDSAVITFGNISSYTNVVLSFGWANAAGKGKVRTMSVAVSGDGGSTWENITFTNSSNATTNDGFHLFEYNVPADLLSGFAVKFTNTSTNTSRVDDVKLVGVN